MGSIPLQHLVMATLVVSLASLILSTVALWPQAKHRFRLVRDAVLWLAFVFVLVAGLHFGFKSFDESTAVERLGNSRRIAPSLTPIVDVYNMPRTDRLRPNRVPPTRDGRVDGIR